MNADGVIHHRSGENTHQALNDGIEERSEVVLGSTAEITNGGDNLSLHGRLIHTCQTQQPLHEIGKGVLKDLLADLVDCAELTQAGSSHRLQIQTDVLLHQSENTADDLGTALLVEDTRERHSTVGNSLQCHEHHTRMAYPSPLDRVPTIIQTLKHNIRKHLEVALDLLLAAVSDMADEHVRHTTLLPHGRVLALIDQLHRRVVHGSVERVGDIGDHLHDISLQQVR